MSDKKIIITGYHGANNLGDDMALYSFLKKLSEISPNTEFELLIPQFFPPENIIVPTNCKVSIDTFFYQNKIANFLKLFKLRKRAQILIWLGGTCFSDEEGMGLFKTMFVSRMIGIKIGFIGVGIGRLNNLFNIIKTRILLSLASIITFRDRDSFKLANEMCKNTNFHLTEDLAFLYLEDIKHLDVKRDEFNILISWRNYEKYMSDSDSEKLIEALIYSLEKLRADICFDRINLMPIDNMIDEQIHLIIENRLNQAFPGVKIINNSELNNFTKKIEVIRKSDLFICGRLHGCFVGIFSAVPTLGLNYSPKVERFFESVNSEGIVNFCDLMSDRGILAKKALKMLALKKNNEARAIGVKSRVSKAFENIQILNDYIND